MGLETKSVMITWHNKTKKYYKSRGYIFTNYGDKFEVNVEDLQDGSEVNVDVQCDGCGKILKNIPWYSYKYHVKEDNTYYCLQCALAGQQKWLSFYEWCYLNLPKEIADCILSRWDYEKNIDKNGNVIAPKDISFSSAGINRKGYWFKCLEYPEHGSELKHIRHFVNGIKGSITCNQCNSIFTTHPELIKYLVNKNDANIYSSGSGVKISTKCPDCGYEKPMIIHKLVTNGYSCCKCGDHISYPNKFMFNVLEQLNYLNKVKSFETEKTFDWLRYEFKGKMRKGRLDFYFKLINKEYAIEMDGNWHTTDNSISGRTKEESKFIDDEKDRVCKEHGIEVIRIDSIKSDWQYIRDNIMNSKLPVLLNFKESDIDWLKCHEWACNSLVKVVCDLWNDKSVGITDIIKILKMSRGTTIKYLKQGAELGWCDYDPKEEKIKNYNLIHKNNKVKVICLTTGEIFNSIQEASKKFNINDSSISSNCKKRTKHGGKLSDGTKLIWMYYNDYKII